MEDILELKKGVSVFLHVIIELEEEENGYNFFRQKSKITNEKQSEKNIYHIFSQNFVTIP